MNRSANRVVVSIQSTICKCVREFVVMAINMPPDNGQVIFELDVSHNMVQALE